MEKGCFSSVLTASEKSEVCKACSDRPRCFEQAQKTMERIYGRFDGFPIDNISSRKKKTPKENT